MLNARAAANFNGSRDNPSGGTRGRREQLRFEDLTPPPLPQISVGMMFVALMTGCAPARAYLVDRGRDAADIFTIAAGMGLGGRVRIGPVHPGVIYCLGDIGLYAGDIVECSGGPCNHWATRESIGSSREQMYPRTFPASKRTGRLESKSYIAESSSVPFITTEFEPFDSSYPSFPHPYWTQCEVQFGLLVSVRSGLNPGELLDFVLGWTTIDIFGDDVGAGK